MSDEDDARFTVVERQINQLAKRFPDGFIVIGGYAVYLHARQAGIRPEVTRDGDFMISRQRFEELKTIRDISDNPRLGKHEFKDGKIGFDLYLEYEKNQLPLDYATVNERSRVIGDVRVASLEHLLILKMKAMNDRSESEHGAKDQRDIVKIVAMLSNPNLEAFGDHLTPEDIKQLEAIEKNAGVFAEITDGNKHQASKFRDEYSLNLKSLKMGLEARRKDRGHGR